MCCRMPAAPGMRHEQQQLSFRSGQALQRSASSRRRVGIASEIVGKLAGGRDHGVQRQRLAELGEHGLMIGRLGFLVDAEST